MIRGTQDDLREQSIFFYYYEYVVTLKKGLPTYLPAYL
jgi:hypothetical protein